MERQTELFHMDRTRLARIIRRHVKTKDNGDWNSIQDREIAVRQVALKEGWRYLSNSELFHDKNYQKLTGCHPTFPYVAPVKDWDEIARRLNEETERREAWIDRCPGGHDVGVFPMDFENEGAYRAKVPYAKPGWDWCRNYLYQKGHVSFNTYIHMDFGINISADMISGIKTEEELLRKLIGLIDYYYQFKCYRVEKRSGSGMRSFTIIDINYVDGKWNNVFPDGAEISDDKIFSLYMALDNEILRSENKLMILRDKVRFFGRDLDQIIDHKTKEFDTDPDAVQEYKKACEKWDAIEDPGTKYRPTYLEDRLQELLCTQEEEYEFEERSIETAKRFLALSEELDAAEAEESSIKSEIKEEVSLKKNEIEDEISLLQEQCRLAGLFNIPKQIRLQIEILKCEEKLYAIGRKESKRKEWIESKSLESLERTTKKIADLRLELNRCQREIDCILGILEEKRPCPDVEPPDRYPGIFDFSGKESVKSGFQPSNDNAAEAQGHTTSAEKTYTIQHGSKTSKLRLTKKLY